VIGLSWLTRSTGTCWSRASSALASPCRHPERHLPVSLNPLFFAFRSLGDACRSLRKNRLDSSGSAQESAGEIPRFER
jgi:hypothetical protein